MKQLSDPNFRNWGGNIRLKPVGYFQPETEEEIIELVKKHSKIRMLGSGHSWSDVCSTDGIIINLDHYSKIIEVDKEKRQVRVQAGIKMHQLNRQLRELGLAVQNQGSIDRQSLAGAVSTGTHGSGIRFGILASQWLEFTLIKADGTKLVINKGKDPDLFNAAVVSMGSLGVITEVLLQASEAFNLHDFTSTVPFDEVIENLDEYIHHNDHFKIWWLVQTNEAVVYRYKRTAEKTNDSRVRRYLKDEVFSVAAYRSLVFGARMFPKLAVPFNRFLTSQMKGPLDRIEESAKVFIVPEPPKHLEAEWAFDVKNAKEILKEYMALMTEKKYNMNFIQEIRFAKADDIWLSGCHGRDTLWLGLYCFKHEKFEDKMKVFEELAVKYNGRPHWGKLFGVEKDYLSRQYPKYDDFIRLRKEFDPEGKFENDYIRRLFS